jgi:alpha-glucosidase
VISIEAARDGFVVLVGGERMIVHSRRSPCIEIGRADISFRRVGSSLCARRRRTRWQPLRAFAVIQNTSELTVIDFGGQLRMSFRREDELLRLSFLRRDPAVNLFRLRIQAQADESIFGLGERGSRIDLKGRRLRLWVDEKGSLREGEGASLAARFGKGGQAFRASSFPVPTFVSSHDYWCSMDAPSFVAFDFRRRAVTTLESWAMPREITLGARKRATAVAADLANLSGKQPSLPSWTWDGAWLGLDPGHCGVEAMAAEVEACLSAGVKLAAVWSEGIVDKKQSALRRRPAWDSAAALALAPAFTDQASRWREAGIRYIGWADPYIDPAGPLYSFANSSRFLVRNQDGGACLVPVTGGHLAMVDLTNPEARAWLKGLLASNLGAAGPAGWVAESGGLLPADAVLASGEDARLMHNSWPILWAKVAAESLAEARRGGEGAFLMRSGWVGSARLVPSVFAGERCATFSRVDGLPSIVPAALSLGLSGIGSFHSEVGGSKPLPRGGRTKEVLLRWMEIAAFSPLFRTRGASPNEVKGRFHADAAWLGQLARMSEIHAALKSYHISVAEEYLAKGLPEIRHAWLHYEKEEALRTRENQYLYGSDLLVAPAVTPGRELTELCLPDDEWVHLWSSRNFRGGLVTVESPVGCPAVFYRASSPFASLFDSVRRTARRL